MKQAEAWVKLADTIQESTLVRAVRDAFESGYCQGHNDTVESRVRDYRSAADAYIDAIGKGI